MARYAARRVGQGLFVLWAAFTVTFVILYYLPSDPVSIMLNRSGDADRRRSRRRWPSCGPSSASTSRSSASTAGACGTPSTAISATRCRAVSRSRR